MVFFEAGFRFPDDAQDSRLQILNAAPGVDEFLFQRVEVDGVDGEVPAAGVAAEVGVIHPLRAAAVAERVVAPESRHLALAAFFANREDAEFDSEPVGAGENLQRIAGRGGSGDVVIAGLNSQQYIPDASPHQIGFPAAGLQSTHNLQRKFPLGSGGKFNLAIDGGKFGAGG